MPSGPEDYRCRECKNLTLYNVDHKTDCIYYVPPITFFQSSN